MSGSLHPTEFVRYADSAAGRARALLLHHSQDFRVLARNALGADRPSLSGPGAKSLRRAEKAPAIKGPGKLAERLEVEFGPFCSADTGPNASQVASSPAGKLVRLRQKFAR